MITDINIFRNSCQLQRVLTNLALVNIRSEFVMHIVLIFEQEWNSI